MTIFIIILMFVATIYAISDIKENGKKVTVGEVTANRHLTTAALIAITVIITGFNVACVYLLACVV
jgi:hypothetical protein